MMWIGAILIFLVSIIYITIGTIVTRRRYSKGSPYLDAPFNLYPVSILKPLKGIDPNLLENLESFFNLDFPQYEILFSVADVNDLAIKIVKQLLEKYPEQNARLIVGEIQVGLNPKVNNLMKSYFESKYDLVLISDAQIRFDKNQLKQIIGHMDTHAGIVTSPVVGIHASGWGGKIQALELTSYVSRMLNFIAYFGHPVVLGKTMLIKKSIATRFGGLRTLANYVAEDYYAGVAVQKLGLNVIVTSRPISEVVGYKSIMDYSYRFIRWGRIRRSQRPLAFILESLVCSLLGPILGSWGFYTLFGIPFVSTLGTFLIYYFIMDLFLIRKINSELLTLDLGKTWILRQILNTFLYVLVHLGRIIIWRGRKIQLKKGGLIDIPTT